MEQSANPAVIVKVGHYTQTISTSTKTHLFSYWQLQQPGIVFLLACLQIGLLAYLLTC